MERQKFGMRAKQQPVHLTCAEGAAHVQESWMELLHRRRAQLTRILLTSCLVVVLGILLSTTLPASPLLSIASAEPQQAETADRIVERWHGIVQEETTSTNSYADCPWVCRGDVHELEREEWDLQVYEDGSVLGTIKTVLVDYSYEQTVTNNGCGPVAETNYTLEQCKYAGQITQPNSTISVQGVRELDYSQKPVLKLTQQSAGEECKMLWRARGIHSETDAIVHKQEETDCSKSLYVPQTFQIVTYEDGRAPQIFMSRSSSYPGSSTIRWGYLTGSVEEPFLELDRELLERSIFLDQVSVEELFTANMNWNSPDGGWITWEFAEQAPERVGPTNASELPKPINNGMQGAGKKQLTVQAQSTLNKTSDPETTQVTVAPPPAWTGGPSQISATKVDGSVAYKSSFKFPDPAFEGIVTVPAIVPFLGDKRLGIAETQGSFAWEAQSTSEGQGALSGQTGFEAMGGNVIGSLGGRARVVLGTEGVQIPEGGMDFSIGGTMASEPEPLLKVVPSLRPALIAIEKISPRAAAFINERAQVKLELQPKLDFGFNFLTQNDEIKFKNAEAKPSFGFKTILEINLIEEVLQATTSIGGAISATFKVPEPYFKEAALQGLVQAQVTLYRFAWEAEKAWSVAISGGAAAASAGNDQAWESNSTSDGWQLMDRSYLDAPDYAQWLGDSAVVQSVMADTDIRLIKNISPLANTSLDAFTNSAGLTRMAQAWVHDEPTFPALSSGEIKFSRNTGTIWQTPAYLTNDNQDDLAPKVTHLPNGTVMVLWQRMDTPTPPDFNGDPAGYLSHWQIAAKIAGTTTSPTQLSASGSLNYRHQIGGTSDGALAVWVNNPANQLIGDTTNPDDILFARYTMVGNTGSWSAAASIVPDVANLLDLDLATNGQFGALVYSLDMDGDLVTTTDQELFYITWNGSSWSAATRLTNNSVADDSPALVLNESGAPLLVWRQGGVLKFLNGDWAGTPVDLPLADAADRPDYDLVRSSDGNLALVWQEAGPEDTQIGYAIYDATHGLWSDQLIHMPPQEGDTGGSATSMATGIAAALLPADDDQDGDYLDGDKGSLVLAYQLAHIELVTETVDGMTIPNVPQIGEHDLRVATLPLRVNLSIAPTDLSLPSADIVQAIIHNSGELAVQNVPVVLYLGTPDPVTGQYTQSSAQTVPLIPAGSTATVSFSIAGRSETVFTVEIDPERTLAESDITDNVAVLGTDLAITNLPAYYGPLGVVVRAQVSQHSPRYISLIVPSILTLNDVNGTQVGGSQIGFPIAPVTDLTISAFISPTHLGPGRHQLYWTVDPDETLGELNRSNNIAGTTVMILPDLAAAQDLVNFGTIPGETAPFQISVQNLGNWANDGGFLEVFDGLPGRSGTHSLLRLPLPAIEPGGNAELSGTLQLAGLPAATSGLSSIYIQLDPDGLVDESNENNNLTASGAVLERTDSTTSGSPLYLPVIQR
jgi:hypothetical protein